MNSLCIVLIGHKQHSTPEVSHSSFLALSVNQLPVVGGIDEDHKVGSTVLPALATSRNPHHQQQKLILRHFTHNLEKVLFQNAEDIGRRIHRKHDQSRTPVIFVNGQSPFNDVCPIRTLLSKFALHIQHLRTVVIYRL